MPQIHTVTCHVDMGDVHTVNNLETIGTYGCSNCVGLIVVHRDGKKTCCHFCSNTGDGLEVIKSRALSTLTNYFPTKTDAMRFGYCSEMQDSNTKAIIEVIDQYYSGLTLEVDGHRPVMKSVRKGMTPMAYTYHAIRLNKGNGIVVGEFTLTDPKASHNSHADLTL